MEFLWHHIRRSLTAAARTAFRFVTLVCVFALQWQAPLPWLHCHGEPGNFVTAQQLDRHNDVFHSDREVRKIDWHLHFAMLDDILRSGGCPVPRSESVDEDQDPHTVERRALVVQIAGRDTLHHLTGSPGVVLQDAIVKTAAQIERRQFLGDHAASRRLQVVLCVAQC